MSTNTSFETAAVNELQDSLRDAELLLEQAAKAGTSQAGGLYTRIAANLGQTKAKLADMEAAVVGRARVAAKVTDQYVHEKPWQSVGIGVTVGAAFGVLLGMLVSRRR